MDEQDKKTVSFDYSYDEPAPVQTVEIEPPVKEESVYTPPAFPVMEQHVYRSPAAPSADQSAQAKPPAQAPAPDNAGFTEQTGQSQPAAPVIDYGSFAGQSSQPQQEVPVIEYGTASEQSGPAQPVAPAADPGSFTDQTSPVAPPPGGGSPSRRNKKKKEKKYITRGTLIACMIATLILGSMLNALIMPLFPGTPPASESRTERDDSELSNLDLGDSTGSELTIAQIVGMNADAVVEIVVSGTSQNMWGQLQLTQGAGSGVIMTEDGYIATNHHVIQGASKVEVTLHNGETYSARIVGSDSEYDIAVIKIDAKGLTTAKIGDSSSVAVGDLAVAIGNPLGQLGGTATTGIISALDRTLSVEGTTLTLIQTDAAINGGNSGGGLFNSKGELIGIVESKASAVGVEGLAFALPINTVSPLINDMIESGGSAQPSKVTPAVGIVISDVSEENAQYYGLESAGVYIAEVTGENAKKAGFQSEDRIVSFNGTAVNSSNDFITLVRKCKVGDTVTVVVSRKGQQIEIKTVLEELQTTE